MKRSSFKKIRTLCIAWLLGLAGSACSQELTAQWAEKYGDWSLGSAMQLKSAPANGNACGYLAGASDLQNNHWDSLSVDLQTGTTAVPAMGILLNYSDTSAYHFLSLTGNGDKLIMELGKKQYGRVRVAERFTYSTQLRATCRYRLRVYRAPWMDKEHWRQWKAELTDLSTGQRVFKESLENVMPFLGMGRTGLFSDGPGVAFLSFHKFSVRPELEKKYLKPAALFGEGMVLQRRKRICIWGISRPGSRVVVMLKGRQATAMAGRDGAWQTYLPAMEAASGLTMELRSGAEQITIPNVSIGEVWVASGQSNMEMRAWQSDVLPQIRSQKKNSGIRFFMQQQWPSEVLETEAGGHWFKWDSTFTWGWSAAALSFAIDLHKTTGVPVGIVQATWGGTGIESWMPREALRKVPQAREMVQRYEQYQQQLMQGTEVKTEWPWSWDIPGQSHAPSYLYNGMIHPLRKYGIRGVLWYQGESNCHRSSQYQYLFPAFLDSWRKAWQDAELYFIGVQLAGYDGRQSGNQVPGAWPLLRDIQRRTLGSDTRALLVTAFDLGDSLDIHPQRKWELGRRMSRAAQQLVSGKTAIPYTGPDMAEVKLFGNRALVRYKKGTADPGKRRGPVNGFEVAGADRKFYPANAEPMQDGLIRLSAPAVQKIEAVRYGWENYPVKAGLKNAAGLAAIPFRTDDWEVKDQYTY